jgi:hypothetical protein
MVAHSLEATAVNRRLSLESALQYLLYVPKKYAIENFRNNLNKRTTILSTKLVGATPICYSTVLMCTPYATCRRDNP